MLPRKADHGSFSKATCQLLHVDGQPGSLVLDLVLLEGDDSEFGASPCDPITVGFAVHPGLPSSQLDDLRTTLTNWNDDDDGILDMYLVPAGGGPGGGQRVVLVHHEDVIVIESN